MKFLCIGSGSIGKRHMRNLLAIGVSPSDITATDPRDDRRDEVKAMGIQSVFATFEEALDAGKYDAAFVCSPTNLHIPQGIELANRGIHILMEKPLAHDLEGIEEFKVAIAANNVVVLMAYIFRFSPLTDKVRELLDSGVIGDVRFVRGEFSEYLPDWHPYEDYRSFYMAEKKQGGGSILDQSHIMDLVHYLFGGFDTVYALNGNLSSLEVNSDDYSELTVKLKNGIIASIHTDMFGRDHKKELEIKGEKGNIYWSSTRNIVTHYDGESRTETVYRKFPPDFNLNYITELKHFLACCEGSEQPRASLQHGIETMELILACYRSVESGAAEKV
ncbi:MAG: Gfo/Idh/MocA family oxidoreductase [Rhodospirillales bacterium]